MATSLYTKSSWYVEQVYLYHQVGLTSQNSDLCILKLQDRDYVIQIKGLSDTNMWSYGFDTCWARLSMVPHYVIHHKIQIAWNFWSLQANTWERLCWGIWPRVCQYTKSSWYVEQLYLYHQVGLTSQNSDLCILKWIETSRSGFVIQIKGLSDTNMWSYGFDTCWARLSMVPHDVIHHKIQIAWNFWSLQANTWERLCWGIWPRVCVY